MKKAFAMLLALMMILSLATPAFAAEDGTHDVVVNFDNKHTPTAEHTLEAYQIFKGTYMFSEETGHETLTDVDWGINVDGAALLEDLQDSEKCPLFAAALAELLADKQKTDSNYKLDADDVAAVLAENSTATNTTWVAEFARTANRHLKGDPAIAKGNDTDPNDKVYSTKYTFTALAEGYYLIKDQEGTLDNTAETYTNLSMRIVGADNFTLKNGTVEVDKSIVMPTSELVEAALADMNGKPVEFEIKGTIPWNFDRFTKFEYEFVDTLTKGLTYNDGSMKVYYQNGMNTPVEFAASAYKATIGEYSSANGTSISVMFEDLVKINKELGNVINDQTKIIVKYSATVNKDAVVGGDGNPNTVHLEFDNDPYSGGKGKTPDDTVWVFTMKMNNTKVDAGNPKITLAGAQFVLSRHRTNAGVSTIEYLVLDGEGKVMNWVSNTAVDALLSANVGTQLTAEQLKTITDAGITLLTSNNEGKFDVIGIKPGSYQMQEVVAPAGYNILEEVLTLNMYATAVEENGAGKLTNVYSDINSIERVNGNADAGSVDFTVQNGAGAVLPETGGMGTTLFYVFGGLMVAAAVVLLVTKKRMAQ